MQIYRSREVGQSYFTSIATTLLATLHAMWLVIRIRPQVVRTVFKSVCAHCVA
jgi:beta-1,4-N-acetylglucosaminyltransferase